MLPTSRYGGGSRANQKLTSQLPTIRPELTGRFLERRLGPSPLELERAERALPNGLCFPGALGARQELRHVLVFGGVVRPPFSRGVPAIISNRHVDAVVNEKLRCLIVPAGGAFVQHASRLMRTPVGIDVGSALQQERRNLKMPVHARPGQRYVQYLLRVGGVQCRFRKTEESLAG